MPKEIYLVKVGMSMMKMVPEWYNSYGGAAKRRAGLRTGNRKSEP